MALDTPIITVARFRRVHESMDLTALFARFPEAQPERIVAVEAMELTFTEARVSLSYTSGMRAIGTVTFDPEERIWTADVLRYDPAAKVADWGAVDVDLPLATLLPFLRDLGRAVLDPDWLED